MTNPLTDPNAAAADASAAVDQSVQHIRQLTEQFLEVAKKGGNASLDAYESALQNLVDFQKQVADASQLEWVSSIAQAHAKFLQDVSSAYVSAARDMLK
jgi:hypothetical protein